MGPQNLHSLHTFVMEVVQLLEEARDLIASVGWCRYDLAVDEDDECADPRTDKAYAFCAIGAILRAPSSFGESTGLHSSCVDELMLTLMNEGWIEIEERDEKYIYKTGPDDSGVMGWEIRYFTGDFHSSLIVADFNDHNPWGLDGVLEVFDSTIARLKAEAAREAEGIIPDQAIWDIDIHELVYAGNLVTP